MKLFSFANDDFSLLRQRFIATLQDDFDVHIARPSFIAEGACGGMPVWTYKTDYILDIVRGNSGEIVIVSDIDIQFFRPVFPHIEAGMRDKDILFQFNPVRSNPFNIGFMAMRCFDRTLTFWKAVRERVRRLGQHDQLAVQSVINASPERTRGATWRKRLSTCCGMPPHSGDRPLRYGMLPSTFWCCCPHHRRHAMPPPNIVLHHATWARTQEEKLAQMDAVRRKIAPTEPPQPSGRLLGS